MKYPTDQEARELICEFGRRIYERGLVSGSEGNISCRTGAEEVWCTPTGESKGYLTEDMLVKLDLEGNILSGTCKPTSECKMHLGLYQENPNTVAVIHAHPVTATAFSCCGRPVPARMLPEAAIIFGDAIEIAPYGMPGTDEIPEAVKPFAARAKACLLENHGALTWGASMKEAYFTMETLENYCKVYKAAYLEIGGAHDIPDPEGLKKLMKRHDAFVQG